MTVVDNRGRLFGFVNLVDATAIGFLLVLIPVAYGTYLLFRPAKPVIDSVSIATITKEEQRIASGALLVAKLKVKGSGFNPLLRATIGSTPSLGFVFESPNSADVLVGQVGPNDRDLILFDGIQEVARVPDAYRTAERPPGVSSYIRGVGLFTGLDQATSDTLKAGYKYPEATPDFEVLAVGAPRPARASFRFATSEFDYPIPGQLEREAVLRIRCDSAVADNPCAQGGRAVGFPTVGLTFTGPGPVYRFTVNEVLPETPGRRARMQVRLQGGPHLGSLKVGDKDSFLDERAAVITSVEARSADAVTVTLDLGLDEAREGWRYRAQRVRPGAPFTLATDRYQAVGRVDSIELAGAERRGGL